MELNPYLDATVLSPSATENDYIRLCNAALKYSFPAICIPPFMIEECKSMIAGSSVKLATVAGFPAGYQTIDIKLAEVSELIHLGADEIDFVVHRGYLANNNWEKIEEETIEWISLCREKNIISKWIIESSELEMIQIDHLINLANKYSPDYVKTSTGIYGKAILEHVVYLRKHLQPHIKIKAAGGIKSRETAMEFIHAGADRLGVSEYEVLI